MSYISPETVCSPKGAVDDVRVVYDKGPQDQSWSVAKMLWKGQEAVGMRWNGNTDDTGIGTPQSRGIATWFIVPPEIADAVLEAAAKLEKGKDRAIMEGYRAMAADRDREEEASAWSEAMIGDAHEAR
jgi:hypothetical protein